MRLGILTFATVALAEVVFVMEFARHGTRTPLKAFHWSPEEPLGELTSEGYNEHLEIGKSLRNRYPGLLSQDYKPEEIYLRSTNFTRTIASLEAQFTGLYDAPMPDDMEVYETMRTDIDFLLFPQEACSRVHWLMERDFMNSTRYFNYLSQLLPFQNAILRLTGITAFNHEPGYYLGDSFLSYEARGIPLPEVDEELVKFAKHSYEFFNSAMLFGNREAMKLTAHRLTSEIIEKTQLVIQGDSKLKLAIYLTHDSTLSAFLKVLGFYNGAPDFSASLLIELHEDAGQHSLRFVYQGQVKVLADCEELCPVADFKKLTQDRRYASEYKWLKLCLSVGDDDESWYTLVKLGVGITVLLTLGLCAQRMLQKIIDNNKKKLR